MESVQAPPRDASTRAGSRLVVASHRLPFAVRFEGEEVVLEPSVGGMASGVEAFLETARTAGVAAAPIWAGWPGVHADGSRRRRVEEAALARGARCVFFRRDEHVRFYDGFSNRTLWPLCHTMPSLVHAEEDEWQAYVAANERFCGAVLAAAGPDDLVWVHDYQLMLLPGMLRARAPRLSVAYFHHIPFPAYDVFRVLPDPWARAILAGVLGADLVGFHTHDYARNFLRGVERLLGHEAPGGTLHRNGRAVRVDAFPMGVDFRRRTEAAGQPEVLAARTRFAPALAGRKVVLSAERLDYTKGIPNRLAAYERLLEREPRFRGQVVLVLVGVPSRGAVEAYRTLRARIEEAIGRVNGRFGSVDWTPILYISRALGFEDLTALYGLADIALVTPLRDGMNLVAKEYLASRPDGTGVLVLSDLAGAARELGEAVFVNPYHVDGIAEGLRRALDMPRDEQERRNAPMRSRLARYDLARWGSEQMQALAAVRDETQALAARRLSASDQEALCAAWAGAGRRLALLDYDGTLVPFAKDPGAAAPDEALVRLLSRLASSPGTEVVIVSGRDAATLDRWLGPCPVGLIAEHGATRRTPGGAWTQAAGPDPHLLARAGEVMDGFADRLPGARVERKATSAAWHWRAADPEVGGTRAGELAEALRALLRGTALRVCPGHKVVEVRSAAADKGTAARGCVLAAGADVVLAVGDDVTDEDLFSAMPPEAWTVKVGPEPSRARFNADGPPQVRVLLEALATAGERVHGAVPTG